jgi:long-chain acyl-CoA synthetase
MLLDALITTEQRAPHTEAVRDPTRSLSFRQLVTFASMLRKVVLNETRREYVGIMLPASAAFNGAFFGTLWANRKAVPLNFLLSAPELADIIRDADLDLILTTRHFDNLTAELPAKSITLESLPLKRMALAAMVRSRPEPPEIDPDDIAVLLYTSGTTGACKGVELTSRSLRSNCDALLQAVSLDDRDRFLGVLPPFHVFGLTGNVLVPTVRGLTTHMIPRFSTSAVLRAIRATRPTVLMAIPSMYTALLRTKSATPDDFQGFKLLVSGGEPLPADIAHGFRERFGVQLLEGYGLTETSPVISLNTNRHNRSGTVGRALPNLNVRILDSEGNEQPSGQDGEIVVKGPSVMRGYHNRPEETAAVLNDGGWFATGDIGVLDADGFLSITGRKKEMMIVGGENVFPIEIEEALRGHPQVEDVAVIGVPDSSRGEIPIAFVTLGQDAEVSEIELRSFARELLAGYKVPRCVNIVDELPRGPTGKVLKNKLAETAARTP